MNVLMPTSFTVSVTLAPAGRPRATQSVVPYARFETQPLMPTGMDAFGVAVHVGVGPTRVCGGGMTVTVGVGGRGLGLAGVGVLGGKVGDGVGVVVCGAFVGAEVVRMGLAVGVSVETGSVARPVAPQPLAKITIATIPARQP